MAGLGHPAKRGFAGTSSAPPNNSGARYARRLFFGGLLQAVCRCQPTPLASGTHRLILETAFPAAGRSHAQPARRALYGAPRSWLEVEPQLLVFELRRCRPLVGALPVVANFLISSEIAATRKNGPVRPKAVFRLRRDSGARMTRVGFVFILGTSSARVQAPAESLFQRGVSLNKL